MSQPESPPQFSRAQFVGTKMTVNLSLKRIATAVMNASIGYELLTVQSRDHAEVGVFLEKREPDFIGK
jgi:enoyl-CoA hydratase